MSRGQRGEVLDRLRKDSRHNLSLLDLVEPPDPGAGSAGAAQIVVAREGREIVGIASLRPSLILETAIGREGISAVLPLLSSLETGLIKSQAQSVAPVWESLKSRGRRPLLDRFEECHVLDCGSAGKDLPGLLPGARLRRAGPEDLEALVFAARSSLREENRPDPLDGDKNGFRLWVQGRLPRARILEVGGRPVFVAYVDVRRPEGWLLQGVYTWPDQRRRGYARAGMAGVIDEAVQAGAEHVQLAVVEGNRPALGLYEELGFNALSRLRTILFH